MRAARIAAVAAMLAQCSAAQPQTGNADLTLSEAELATAVASLNLPDDASVLIAAGDIARCNFLEPAYATAALVEAIVAAADDALVITAGDHAYQRGTEREFQRCYDPTWGRFEEITRPTPGNHDYDTTEGTPFYEYFSFFDANPTASAGFYSFRFADWHIVALNSLIDMDDDSAQIEWLEADLRNADADCILAFWHHPLYSSGLRSLLPWYRGRRTDEAWEVLMEHDAEIVVNGHEHLYERFAPLDDDGERTANGIRQFTVGTGGGELSERVLDREHREALYDGFGVLVLSLAPDSYRYQFIGVGGSVHDASDGPISCSS